MRSCSQRAGARDGRASGSSSSPAGLTTGAIYALVALGFSIIYNASSAINFAQGEFVMIGGMSRGDRWSRVGLPLAAAVPLAVLAAVVVGLLVEKLAIEPAQHTAGRR